MLPDRTDSRMKLFLLRIFTWWNGFTFGTQFWTWRFGELVGTDPGEMNAPPSWSGSALPGDGGLSPVGMV